MADTQIVNVSPHGDALGKANLTDGAWRKMKAFAAEAKASGLVPANITEGQIIIKIQTGRELGLPPSTSLRHLYVVNGKVALEGEAMLALILADPRCEEVDYGWDDKKNAAYCYMLRSKPKIQQKTWFSLADAQRANLTGNDPWKKYPEVMATWRAISICARRVWADVILGVYLPEELGVAVTVNPVTQAPEAEPEILDGDFEKIDEIMAEVGNGDAPDAPDAPPESDPTGTPAAGENRLECENDPWAEVEQEVRRLSGELGYSDAKVAEDLANCETAEHVALLGIEYAARLAAKAEPKKSYEKPEAGSVGKLL